MHPAMAVWIWSMTMARAWQTSLWEDARVFGFGKIDRPDTSRAADWAQRIYIQPGVVLATPYLYSDIAEKPLPDKLLDRLADLYWTERDEEMAI